MSPPGEPPTERDDACPGASVIAAFLDGELAPRERASLEIHLAGCDACRSLLSALAPDTTGPSSDPSGDAHAATVPQTPALAEPSAPVEPGDLVGGKFRVTRVLGKGGMGVVVAAEHLVLHQPVALKFLLPGPGVDRRAAARFLREARVSARLSSEHIARVLDYGLLPRGGAPYLVLEYLEGEDLGARLERSGRLPLSDALDLLLQAAEGLSVAHQAGVVHRDLKPSNLFVVERGGAPLVKLLDFGIAKAERFDTHGAGLTTGEGFLGSPRYASPEQLQSARAVDARSDLWSLGCVAYEMLTGRPPFDGETLTNLVAAILTSEPLPPRDLEPSLPVEVERALLACLRKAPDDRPRSVAEMVAPLAPFASDDAQVIARRIARSAGLPALSSPPPAPSPAGRAGARRTAPLLAASLAALVLSVAAAAALSRSHLAEPSTLAASPPLPPSPSAPPSSLPPPTAAAPASAAVAASAASPSASAPPSARPASRKPPSPRPAQPTSGGGVDDRK